MIILPDTPTYMEVNAVKQTYVKRHITILEKNPSFSSIDLSWIFELLDIKEKDFYDFLRESLYIFEYPNLIRDKELTQTQGTKRNHLFGKNGYFFTKDSLNGWYVYVHLKNAEIRFELSLKTDYFKIINKGREYLCIESEYPSIRCPESYHWIDFKGFRFAEGFKHKGFKIKGGFCYDYDYKEGDFVSCDYFKNEGV